VSGEKTVQAEPLLEAKIVSVVSTSPLRGVEVQQDSPRARLPQTSRKARSSKSWVSETADGEPRQSGLGEAGDFS